MVCANTTNPGSQIGENLLSTLEFCINFTNANYMLQFFSVLVKTYFKCDHIFILNLLLLKIGQVA